MPEPGDPRTLTVRADDGSEWCCGAYATRLLACQGTQLSRLREAGKLKYLQPPGNEVLFGRARGLLGRVRGRPQHYLYSVRSVEELANSNSRSPDDGSSTDSKSPRLDVAVTGDKRGGSGRASSEEDPPGPETERDFGYLALLREFKDVIRERDDLRAERDSFKGQVDRLTLLVIGLTQEADERNRTLRQYFGT